MGEAQIRTTFDHRLTYQVTAPGNGTAAAQIYSLLTGAQQTELNAALGAGFVVASLQLSPIATAINYFHAVPSNMTFVLSTNSNAMSIGIGQKPNEVIPVMQADKKIFIQSSTVGAVVVQVVLDCVSKDLF